MIRIRRHHIAVVWRHHYAKQHIDGTDSNDRMCRSHSGSIGGGYDHAWHASNHSNGSRAHRTCIAPFCVLASFRGEKQNRSLGVTQSVNLPARLDWSIMGCTIRRRALMNLEEERSVRTLQRTQTAALIPSPFLFLVIRQADVSTCQHSVYNIEEQNRKKMINDSKHHLLS